MGSGDEHTADQPRHDDTWRALLGAVVDIPREPLDVLLQRLVEAACAVVRCRCALAVLIDETSGTPRRVVAGVEPPPDDVPDPRGAAPMRTDVAIAVPVRVDDAPAGALHLFRRADDSPFTEADAEVAQLLARALADLLHRVAVVQASDRRQRWLSESADLTRELLSGKHDDPLRLVVDRIWKIADADLVVVATERPEPNSYTVIEAAGPHAPAVRGWTLDPSSTFAARVIAENAPLVVADISAETARSQLGEFIGAKSAVFVPLRIAGGERGMLAAFRRSDRPPFATADVEATTTFAAQVSLALQLADTRTQWEHGVLLDERGRIARDLHDHVIQRLFAIGLSVHGVSAQVDSTSAQRLLEGVDALDETITQIRSTIYRLTGPIVSTENSIRNRVVRLVGELEPVLGFAPELEFKGPVDFGVDEEVTADCIAVLREALTNVARHADATRVTVVVMASTSQVTLEVVDDGRGIGAQTRRSGLANMRTRAEQRGGALMITPAAPKGTQLTWTVPVNGARESLWTAAQ